MIQRIQSLYLLAVTVLVVMMLAMPLGKFLAGDTEFVLKAFRLDQTGGDPAVVVLSTVYMGILMVLAAVLPFITIFLFKNRLLQIRLCFMEMVFLFGLQVFVVYYLWKVYGSFTGLSEMTFSFSVVAVFPVISMILTWMAIRGIIRDEGLVRSLDRIR